MTQDQIRHAFVEDAMEEAMINFDGDLSPEALMDVAKQAWKDSASLDLDSP